VTLALLWCAVACAAGETPERAAASSTSSSSSTSARRARGELATVDFRNHTFDFDALTASAGGPLGSDAVGGSWELHDGLASRTADDGATTFVAVIDVDYVDVDGDGSDEAAVTVLTGSSQSSGRFSNVLVYRWAGGPELVGDDGWGDRSTHGVQRVDTDPSGRHLVVRRLEPVRESCCTFAVEQRRLTVEGDRLVELGEAERWPVIRRRAPMSPSGPARDPIAVSFFPGSTRFAVTGDVADEMGPVTFDALAGQTLALRVDPAGEHEPEVEVTVVGPDGAEVGSVRSGEARSGEAGSPAIDLPASGGYEIRVASLTPVGDVSLDDRAQFWVDAELGD